MKLHWNITDAFTHVQFYILKLALSESEKSVGTESLTKDKLTLALANADGANEKETANNRREMEL